jgi:hypothetical protein
LVLLAVVLIVALVSVALLGFFPGMASDTQMAQSKTYWSSASPIAIIEAGAKARLANDNQTFIYLRVRNNGATPIRITKLLGANGRNMSYWCNGPYNLISDYYYLAPGEEKYFGNNDPAYPGYFDLPLCRRVYIEKDGERTYDCSLAAAASLCNPQSTDSPGALVINKFGFEYENYVEGQTITKKQVGAAPFIIKCTR